MNISDPIADMLTRLRNASRARHATTTIPASRLKARIAEILVSEGYIREVPVDPMTKSKDMWQTRQAEPDANNPASAGGVDDVHSGSDRTALDGTRYADWD